MRSSRTSVPAAGITPAADAATALPARWPSSITTSLPAARRLLLLIAPLALVAYSVSYERAVSSNLPGSFPWWVNVAAYLGAATALYASRRSPLLAAIAAAVCWWATDSALFVIAASLLLGYRQPRRWIIYLIGLSILHPMAIVPDPLSFVTGQVLLPSWSVPLYSCFLSALVGVALRTAHNTTIQRERDLERSVIEAEASAELAVAEERLRMSREMHDILGHHLSTMVLLSTALVAQPDAARARSIAERIADNGHRAIDDLQYILRFLDGPSGSTTGTSAADAAPDRPTPDRPTPERPTPTERLTEAIDAAEQFGHEVHTHGGLGPASTEPHLELGVDTIVEAVHNTMKHAPGARIRIDAASTPEAMRVTVTNERATRNAPERALGTGSGLRLLAARAHAVGGTFHAADRATGGYRITLEIPR